MIEEQTLRTWLAHAVRGETLAAQKLIMAYHRRLLALARDRLDRALRSKIAAEDVLQEVYVDVMRNIRRFGRQDPGSFFRWMIRVLDSKLTDARRFYHATIRDVGREVPAAAAQTPSSYDRLLSQGALESVTPSRILARQELQSILMAALAGLSEDRRQVIELRYLKGLPLTEVAERMQRSVPAVQMLAARAMRQLRDSLRRLSNISEFG